MPWNCSKKPSDRQGHRGLTLIEVIASLMLVGSLLAGVLMAHRRCARQTKLAVQRLDAIASLDGFMLELQDRPESETAVSFEQARGKVPGENKFQWRKLVLSDAVAGTLRLSRLRIEVFDPAFEAGETLAFVEIVAPARTALGAVDGSP